MAAWRCRQAGEVCHDEFMATRILLIEDDDRIRETTRLVLEDEGYDVDEAPSAETGLVMFGQRPPGCVIVDLMLPGINGFECCRALRQASDVPIVVLTARTDTHDLVAGLEAGADDYLTKPFDPVLLRARVGACVEKKRLRDQEIEYLRQVARVTSAASAVETGSYEAGALAEVAARPDALGQLARIFEQMAREVQAREQRLQQQVQELRIEIDRAREAQQVAEITGSDYFQQLKQSALRARDRAHRSPEQ